MLYNVLHLELWPIYSQSLNLQEIISSPRPFNTPSDCALKGECECDLRVYAVWYIINFERTRSATNSHNI